MTTYTAEAYTAALNAAGLPDWLRWSVAVRPRRKSLGFTVEPGGAVTVAVPPGTAPRHLVTSLRSHLGRLRRAVREQEERAPLNPVKEWLNGQGFQLFGRNHKLRLVDQMPEEYAHLPCVREPGPSTWSGVRTWQLTMRRDAASVEAVVGWYRREGLAWLTERAPEHAQRIGVNPLPELRVRTYDPRAPRTWATYLPGSHAISVHWAAFQADRSLCEYLLAHEMAHAAWPRGANHGAEWARLVERMVPDWEDKRDRLNKAGRDFWWGHVAEPAAPALTPAGPDTVASLAELVARHTPSQ